MKYTLRIHRKKRSSDERYWQDFIYESTDENETVANALTKIDVKWECSCMQEKCGACAMIINNTPSLACGYKLSRCKNGICKLEPLRKFPVVCDLIVDRSILHENLKTMKIWLRQDADFEKNKDPLYRELAYESSECIQCGLCLEVCPNFYLGGDFFGASTVPLTLRLLSESDRENFIENAKLYVKHEFEGCGKSFACKAICPRHIDTERMMVKLNRVAVWKRKK